MADVAQKPQPHKAPSKSTVSAVLHTVGRTISSLVTLLTGLLAASLILYSGYVLYETFYTQNQAFSGTWDVIQYKPDLGENGIPGPSELASINRDYRAWLTVYETYLDYPVMQGVDDLYYATHDIFGKSSVTGAVYLATGNTADLSDAYNLLYGHHMDNGAMFGALDDYLSEDYILEHKEGVLIAPDKVYPLEVFAVIETDAYERGVYSVGPNRTVADVLAFLNHLPAGCKLHYYDAAAAARAVKITALSTCADAETNGRLVVFCMTPSDGTGGVIYGPTDPNDPSKPYDPNDPNDPTNTDSSDDTHEPEDPHISDGSTDAPDGAGTNAGGRGTGGTDIRGGSTGINGGIDGGVIKDPEQTRELPLAPRGQGLRVWALLNLICTILTVYLLLPLLHLRDKYKRRKLIEELMSVEAQEQALAEASPEPSADEPAQEEAEEEEEKTPFRKRIRADVLCGLLLSVLAIVVFILTEDMRLPMVLIDRWTLLMIVILAAAWLLDVRLARYREKDEEEQAQSEEAEKQTADV